MGKQAQAIDVSWDDHLLVQCMAGTDIPDAIKAAQEFCKQFEVKSIIIHHNDNFIQVDSHGKRK